MTHHALLSPTLTSFDFLVLSLCARIEKPTARWIHGTAMQLFGLDIDHAAIYVSLRWLECASLLLRCESDGASVFRITPTGVAVLEQTRLHYAALVAFKDCIPA